MQAHYRKRKTRYEFELTGKGRTTAHGGQVLVDTLCRRYRLWERISRIEGIDPRKRKGSGHDPEAMEEAQTFATCRWRKPEEMFWRYAFVACEKDAPRTPRAVFERHRLKGACEQRFSEVLADLDLHHPPC